VTDFGDWEPPDSYAEAVEADRLQVARRLHEDRIAVEHLAGREVPRWPELGDDGHDVALLVAEQVYAALHAEPDAGVAARRVHEARRQLDPTVEPWDQLDPMAQVMAVDLMTLTLDWLQLENTA
jgi:hypothetical protein